ncbi:MAG TPA: DUF4159 domain-containing protein, partial [Longimicrobiales bacterium]|nr:DUF4159 domain-containing protein [Longimicrobiales bacterium]
GDAGAGGAIAALGWEATPPAYAGASPVRGSGSDAIRALEGSAVRARVEVRGSGRLAARVIGGEAPEIADARRPAWRLAAGNRALLLELLNGDSVVDRRLLALQPVRDDPPRVELAAPDRDMTLAEGRGALEVRAEAVDDIGVGALELRWIRSRGGGESYSFDEGTLPWTDTDRARGRATASTRLALAALDLGPGDVLHLRAVARDTRNVAGGPGEGVSETRTIRVAREDEEALVDAVLTLPARAEENPILSQRMLILLTERLIAEAPAPAALAARAEEIAVQQARLRGRVGEVIFSRVGDGSEDAPADPFAPAEDVFGGDPAQDEHDLEEGYDPLDPEDVLEAANRATGTGDEEALEHRHDEGAVLSVNRDLLAAYNAMWEAERHLRQAAAGASLPPQHRALDLLQQIRSGERVFARGRVAVPPVDVAAARGTGELDGVRPAARAAAPATGARATRAAELESLVRRWAELAPEATALAASEIAVRLYEDPAVDPRAGALVGRAAEAARAGRRAEGREFLGAALRLISPPAGGGGAPIAAARGGAAYFRALADAERSSGTADAARPPAGTFVFATARYASGDWDSAPLVPANLTHSIAQYTDIPVAPDPVDVDLGSPEVFRYPFLFLTGHLPVRFTAAESANLRAWVERGGLIFIDDHNHDIDAAFHRSVVAEIERIFGAGALVDLPNDHELYRAFFRFPDGPPTTAHELNGWGDGLVHERLRAVMVGGRIGVLYSNKDYASQWSYLARNKRFNAVDDTRFGVNVIVYALTR